ncbi:MAG: hypothetical protein OXP12_09870 [Thaumarchaeota archaeon]|nr:hypothetical protein [Nitrososphaerota archaeon]MDE0266427.1 hypothetical protein [Nitrososphaerota archaeon]
MERLPRFALYLAIGVGMTVFVLFLIASLPFIIEDSWDRWEELDKSGVSRDEMYSKMTAHPAYLAMYEVYPDAKEEFVYRDRSGADLQVGVMSFETQNRLLLDLRYYPPEDRTHANIYCSVGEDHRAMRADGLFVEDFIRNTDCLEAAGTADGSKQATAVPVVSE